MEGFVRRGEVLFRSLSYFRDYEDQVGGDEFEGTKLHHPERGLEITLTKTQEKIVLPHSFESAANEDDIFVFRVENTRLRLVEPSDRRHPRSYAHPERLLKLGSLKDFCKVHRFDQHGASQ